MEVHLFHGCLLLFCAYPAELWWFSMPAQSLSLASNPFHPLPQSAVEPHFCRKEQLYNALEWFACLHKQRVNLWGTESCEAFRKMPLVDWNPQSCHALVAVSSDKSDLLLGETDNKVVWDSLLLHSCLKLCHFPLLPDKTLLHFSPSGKVWLQHDTSTKSGFIA